MQRDRLTWLLRRIALGLPLGLAALPTAPLVAGCSSSPADPDAAGPELSDGSWGPSCMACGSIEIAVTHRHVLERGLDPDDCMSACSSLAMPASTCGGGGIPGAGLPQVTGCSILERIEGDAGPLTLDAGADDAGPDDAGVDPLGGVVARLSCDLELCRPAGRRPAALRMARHTGGSVGRWLAEVATLEAASVPAFAELRRELRAHRAPARLVAATLRAQADESLHARLVAGLASRTASAPARAHVTQTEPRTLAELTTHNAAEGCVREAYGALAALAQSHTARDPMVRRVFARIARDEARHALLSLELDAWARPRVRPIDRSRADEAAALAADELRTIAASDTSEMRETLGLPDEDRARDLVSLCA